MMKMVLMLTMLLMMTMIAMMVNMMEPGVMAKSDKVPAGMLMTMS